MEVCDYVRTIPHSYYIDGKVAGVISRIRRTQEKNLCSIQTPRQTHHTRAHALHLSSPWLSPFPPPEPFEDNFFLLP